MINKRVIMVLMALMILIIGVTAVSAEDLSGNNLTSSESTVSTADTTNTADITSDVTNTESIEPKTSNQIKSSKLTAGESSKYNITQDTYSNYFNGSGYLSDDVNNGDTLDIQGIINITDGRMVINKAVNIVSTTDDGTIAFNTPYGAPNYTFYGDNLPKVAFIINNGGSYTNVTGISFVNTQVWSTNNSHVTFDGLNVSATGGTIGSGVGHFSIRPNSTYTTVKNSYIKTAGSGSSAVVFTAVKYCSAINNTFDSTGGSGNILYLNMFGVNSIGEVNPENPNCYNELINNTILGPVGGGSTTYGLTLTGSNNTVDNNTINYTGSGITSGFGSTSSNNTIINNDLVGGCGIVGAFTNTVYENNSMEGSLTLRNDAVATGNKAKTVTISGTNVIFENNTVSDKLTVSSNGASIINNTVDSINLNSANNVVSSNTINNHMNVTKNNNTITFNDFSNSDNSYAIKVTGSNNLIANTYPESMTEPITDTGSNNTVANIHLITQDTYPTYFNESGYLTDLVAEGDILDIQGIINITDGRMVINKAVNIVSSTEDGTLAFNTPYGAPNYTFYGDNLPKVAFIINKDGSYTNVTGINFINTQIWSTNNTHVTFDGLNVSATGGTIGSGVGHFALRPNSTYTTVKNSYIKTAGSTSSAVVFTAVKYCSAINNTIDSTGGSGNILYLNTFGVASIGEVNPENPNCYNELINNTILGPVGGGSITYGLTLTGSNNTVDGNTINYTGSGITSGFGSTSSNNTIINNNLIGGCGIVGTFTNTVYENNTMEGSLTLRNDAVATGMKAKTVTISGTNVEFTDNEVTDKLTISSANATVTGNTLNDVAVTTANNIIADNNISGTITGTPSTTSITNNTIITDNTYTMQFTKLTNSNITNNYLIAGTNAGERTISVTTNTDSIIENNKPEVMDDLIITDDTYSQFFTDGIFTYTVTDYATVVLNGPFYNKDFIFTDNILNIKGNNATIYNGTIELKDNVRATVDDIAFVNEDDEIENVIIVSTPNNIIQRTKITQTRSTKGNAQPIYVSTKDNQIINNEITISSVASDIDYSGTPYIAPVAAIVVLDSNNNVSNNVIDVTVTSVDGDYPTSEAITVQGFEDSPAENNTVTKNTITVTGLNGYQYGINVGSYANGNEISNNNIKVTSTGYSDGIQVSTPIAANNKITSNTINVTANGEAGIVYGVILNNWGSNTDNTVINSNTIYGQANAVYLIEYAVTSGGQGSDSTVNSNKLYGTGNYTVGIGIEATDVTVNSNTIEINGTTNETDESSYDAIKPTTAGILLQNTKDGTINSNTITANGGPAIKLISESENNVFNLNKLVSDNVAIYLLNSNDNIIENQTINNLYDYTVALENAAGNKITNNYLNGSDYYGGDESVQIISGEDNTVENNRPSIIVITDDNYSTYFDENSTFVVENPNYVTIGSDLNNKDLIFTSGVNITNGDDYTINNGSIILNIDSIANSKNMYINNINFDNTDKEAYIINVNDTVSSGQINIYINGGDIKVTGEDVTAIDVPLNITHVYLDVENTNITVDGEKATAVNNVGKIKEGYLEFAYNNVTVTGKESAIAINLTSSDTEIYDNNFIINSNGTARALIANNSRIRYSDGFSNNNITGSAPDINAITYMNKPTTDSSSHYIRYNNIDLTSENPITAIDIENVYGIIVQYNNITASAVNNETPVILLSNVTGYLRSSGDRYSYFNVRYNYVTADDVFGDDAIESTDDSTIMVELNYPDASIIEITSDLSGRRTDTINITAIVKNATSGTTVTSGNVTFVVANETLGTVEIANGVATIEYTIPAGSNSTNVTAIYDGSYYYAKSETTNELEVIVYQADVTVLTSKESYKPQDTITLTAIVSENGVLLNSGKVVFKLNGLTLKENSTAIIANVENGYATVTYTLPYLSRDQYNITAVYSNPYYDRAEGYNVLNIVKSSTQIRATATTDGTLTTITGTILDSDNNAVNGVTKLTIKINGLTYVKEVNVTNGLIDETFDTSTLKLDKFYNLTIIAGENKLYQSAIYNTVFSISSTSITKVETEVLINSVVDENNQTTVVGTVVDAKGNAVKGTSKVTVKANGITVLNKESIQDGQINLSFDSSTLTASEYDLTIIYEGSSVYNSSQGNSTLIRV